MKFSNKSALENVLTALFDRYAERVPDVKKISDAMVRKGMIVDSEEIVNDHIAFRTLGVKNLGIQSFEKIFLHYGYVKRDAYYFEKKKLNAFWYAPPSPLYPRIFLSELRVSDLSQEAQRVIANYTSEIKNDPVDSLDLNDGEAVGDFLHKGLWPLPTMADYDTLASESEYAAWVIYNRYYLNHYTISVHNLKNGYNELASFNTFLEEIGIKLNDAGGKIKSSTDGMLLQSSSVAPLIETTFACGGTKKISGSYVEFAERKVLPEFKHLATEEIKNEHRRDGFEAANADKIFESTYSRQVNRPQEKN